MRVAVTLSASLFVLGASAASANDISAEAWVADGLRRRKGRGEVNGSWRLLQPAQCRCRGHPLDILAARFASEGEFVEVVDRCGCDVDKPNGPPAIGAVNAPISRSHERPVRCASGCIPDFALTRRLVLSDLRHVRNHLLRDD